MENVRNYYNTSHLCWAWYYRPIALLIVISTQLRKLFWNDFNLSKNLCLFTSWASRRIIRQSEKSKNNWYSRKTLEQRKVSNLRPSLTSLRRFTESDPRLRSQKTNHSFRKILFRIKSIWNSEHSVLSLKTHTRKI